MKHVVILGAGFGGLELASRLSYAHAGEVRVTLIDRSDAFTFGFSKLDILFGGSDAAAVRIRTASSRSRPSSSGGSASPRSTPRPRTRSLRRRVPAARPARRAGNQKRDRDPHRRADGRAGSDHARGVPGLPRRARGAGDRVPGEDPGGRARPVKQGGRARERPRLRGETSSRRYEGEGDCYVEFGGGRVAQVRANFLGGPSPTVEIVGPSQDLAAAKKEFAPVRRARWFGA